MRCLSQSRKLAWIKSLVLETRSGKLFGHSVDEAVGLPYRLIPVEEGETPEEVFLKVGNNEGGQAQRLEPLSSNYCQKGY